MDSEEYSESDSSYEDISDESGSDEDTLDAASNWCRIDQENLAPPPPRFPFSGNPGLNTRMDGSSPIEFFCIFFNDDIVGYIASETNRYAEDFIEKNDLTPSSRVQKWKDVDSSEIRVFFGIIILQESSNQVTFQKGMCQLMNPYYCIKEDWAANSTYQKREPGSGLNSISYANLPVVIFGIALFTQERICHCGMNPPITTTNIVMTLLEDLLDKGYCVTLDNFYTSPELAELLLSHRTDVYGTLRPNRISVHEEIKKGTLKKGEIVGFQKGKICVMKYMDKKPISILSPVHNTVIVEQDKKRKKTHGKSERIVSKKPQAIIDYNLTMGGVDKANQCLSYYPTVRNQQKKYYLKIFRQILNQSVWNSFVLHKNNGGTMSHLDFRLQLVEELAKIYGKSKHSSQNTTSSDRLIGRHFPSRIQPTQKKKAPTKICIVCSPKFNEKGQRVRKESRYQCSQCNVTLCVTPCFEKYHTVENF
ncbi:PiggyBac transposable element-derived protein 4 [Araneus ventricosus]|uniref:PiggyBac transposable element-derived protein 4 n=1 Tax=Araneus ventricosus TaxID=182803 RepID=A0A4Y2E006_ARAVE|nr:PiggyBac transposable element-derived protein 4 [Araneus ventricosus]